MMDKARVILEDLANMLKGKNFPELFFQKGGLCDREYLDLGIKSLKHERDFFERHGIDFPKSAAHEIILICTTGVGKCYLPPYNVSTFMVLGPEHGVSAPSGGILTAEYDGCGGAKEYTLRQQRKGVNDIFQIPRREMRAFFADPGFQLTVIGFAIQHKEYKLSYANAQIFDYVLRELGRVDVRLKGKS